MPTEPVETVLNRHLSRVAAHDLIERYCPLLDEIVNYGTALYARSSCGTTDVLTAEGVPLLIYLHTIEMTDGVSEVLRESCVAPAIPLVRAVFESALALEYIFESGSTCRAQLWLVGYLLEQLDVCNKILGEEKAGQEFHEALKSDSIGSSVDLAKLERFAKAQKPKLEAALARPELAAEVVARAGSKKRHPNWYSFFGGPTNLRQLSKHLKREAQYLVLYGYFSSISHGQNTRRFITRAASADPLTRLLRDSSDLPRMGTLAASFALRATRLLSQRRGEGEQYSKWYVKEIRPRFIGENGA